MQQAAVSHKVLQRHGLQQVLQVLRVDMSKCGLAERKVLSAYRRQLHKHQHAMELEERGAKRLGRGLVPDIAHMLMTSHSFLY